MIQATEKAICVDGDALVQHHRRKQWNGIHIGINIHGSVKKCSRLMCFTTN
jgi:hypothetical protein